MALSQRVTINNCYRSSWTTYSCRKKQGALLTLPHDGLRKDLIRTKTAENYVRDHVDRWYSFAQRRRLDVERMEELVLVTGCTLVTSWGVAAFVDSTQDAELLLKFREPVFEWREIRPSVAYQSSHPVRPHSQYRSFAKRNFFYRFDSIIHARTNACSSEGFEQSASSYGLVLRAQRSPFLMMIITDEKMRNKYPESRMLTV